MAYFVLRKGEHFHISVQYCQEWIRSLLSGQPVTIPRAGDNLTLDNDTSTVLRVACPRVVLQRLELVPLLQGKESDTMLMLRTSLHTDT